MTKALSLIKLTRWLSFSKRRGVILLSGYHIIFSHDGKSRTAKKRHVNLFLTQACSYEVMTKRDKTTKINLQSWQKLLWTTRASNKSRCIFLQS